MRYDFNLFARWLIKHYETSIDGNSFCYRNPMGEIVEISAIVDHYMNELRAERVETEKLIGRFVDTTPERDYIAENKWRIENREQLREQRKQELKELMEKDKQTYGGGEQ